MDFGIDGKTALVAASSKGLGRAVAEELASEGARVILCARGADALEATRAALADAGAEVTAVVADLTDPQQIEHVIETGVQTFGPVDILVTNTGGPPPGPFESHTPETWTQAVRENLDPVLNLTRSVLPGMKERGWGRIVTITSLAVKQPVDGLILSNSVRAAVTGFAKTLANEVAPFGITVNNVMPGYTRTERLDHLAADIAERSGGSIDDAFAVWEGEIPLGRVGDPREFGALVAFLASERASYITGTSIAVDGGAIKALL
ncbi:MAG: SDR family oxidoreductase [Gemmatimonadota bacterium]|nr:MAG: SDR family oxidoreductase [Gemmatimonadota bacterium]